MLKTEDIDGVTTRTDLPRTVESATGTGSRSRFDPAHYRQARHVDLGGDSFPERFVQTIIPVRKPSPRQFVRVHPSEEFRITVPTLLNEATGDIHLLAPEFELPSNMSNKIDYLHLAAAISADKSLFLWQFKDSTNSWSDSARIAIRRATKEWVRVIADRSSNGYKLERPISPPPDPEWPDLSFTEWLETAFGSRYIDSERHPLVRSLRGEFGA